MLIHYMLQYIYGIEYMEEHEQEEQTYTKKTKKGIVWANSLVQDEEWTTSCEHEADTSTGPIPGNDSRVHAQMCAVADFYGVSGLQPITRHKFEIALERLRNVQHLVELLELVCDPEFQCDIELRDMMVDKIVAHGTLLDNPEIEAILLNNPELALLIAKRLRRRV